MVALTRADLKIGHVYSGKRRARTGPFMAPVWNDRQIKWIDSLGLQLQYDGPAVANGRHYPKIDVDAFLKWASHDVTDQCPEGDWRSAL